MSQSNALENQLLDLVLGGVAYTPETDHWISLYTAVPTDAGGGTEVAGGSYARLQVANNATTWPAAVAGVKSNGIDFDFPQATAPWGKIVAFGVHGHATNDELICWGLVIPNVTVNNGGEPSFPAGSLVVNSD